MANPRYRIFVKGTNTPIFSSDNFRAVEEYYNKLGKYTDPKLRYYVAEHKGGYYQEIDPPKYTQAGKSW